MSYMIEAIVKVPDNVSEMVGKAVSEKGNKGLLETLMKVILHAMVDDAYYKDLKKVCEANALDPLDGQKPTIKTTFVGKSWECVILGRIGHASPLGRAHIIADCHGMTLSEYLTQCLHCGPTIVDINTDNSGIQDLTGHTE